MNLSGRMILSGGGDGLIAVSSRTTGMTVRVINDQQGAPLTGIDVQPSQVSTVTCFCFHLLYVIRSVLMQVSQRLSIQNVLVCVILSSSGCFSPFCLSVTPLVKKLLMFFMEFFLMTKIGLI